MKLEMDEERLTAYALGECEPAERAEIEAYLQQNEAARKQVEDIRATAETLTAELKSEKSPGLAEKHREAIAGGIAAKKVIRLGAEKKASSWSMLAIAASVLVVVGVIGLVLPRLDSSKKQVAAIAKSDPVSRSYRESEEVNRRTEFSDSVALGAPTASTAPKSSESNDIVVPPDILRKAELTDHFETVNPDGPSAQSALGVAGTGGGWGGGNATGNGAGVFGSRNGGGRRLMVKRAKKESAAGDAAVNSRWGFNAYEEANTEAYDSIVENPFKAVMQNPLSTFSIDVDTASYANMRRHLQQRTLPPKDAIRIEEMVNYFPYSYEGPQNDEPFAAAMEVAQCPWEPKHRLARIAIKGKEIAEDKRPSSNLVFLIDVSGSMGSANKLPLVQSSLKLLVNKLGENDRVAIVVYAGASGLALPSTTCDRKADIIGALDRLHAGGGTNGAQGIQLAYDTAVANFIKGGTNRVILCTDGDWNIGVTSDGDLERLITDKAKTGVFLSILGFGMGNYKDAKMEKMAGKGNGNNSYIDTEKEAQKVLVEQMGGTLITIAKDVKIQVEFNPAQVNAYRLIGYENRMLAAEDFNNDKKDAGEIGAGHTVTALYEIVPTGKKVETPAVDPLKYQVASSLTNDAYTTELLTLKIRYKQPDGDTSKLLQFAVSDSNHNYAKATKDYKFAAAVASFGMLLRGSEHKGNATFDSILELAEEAKLEDKGGYRAEFIELVKTAKGLTQPESKRLEE